METETIETFLAEAKERRKYEAGVEIGTIPVDSGCVQFTFNGRLNQKKMTALHEQLEEMTLGTHRAGFDGTIGFVKLGSDGGVTVMECHAYNQPPVKCQYLGQLFAPEDATIIGLGDCGKVYHKIKLQVARSARFYLQDHELGMRLWVMV